MGGGGQGAGVCLSLVGTPNCRKHVQNRVMPGLVVKTLSDLLPVSPREKLGKMVKSRLKPVKTQYAGKNLGKTIKIQGKCQATLKTCRVLPRFMMCY